MGSRKVFQTELLLSAQSSRSWRGSGSPKPDVPVLTLSTCYRACLSHSLMRRFLASKALIGPCSTLISS